MMNNSYIERNVELSGEFSRYLFDHPEVEEGLPEDAEVILIPEYDEDLAEYNRGLGREIEREGGKVVYISVKGLRPRRLSRIEALSLEAAV